MKNLLILAKKQKKKPKIVIRKNKINIVTHIFIYLAFSVYLFVKLVGNQFYFYFITF